MIRKSPLNLIATSTILFVLIILVAFPLFWCVTISFRPSSDLFLRKIFPSLLVLTNFKEIFLNKNWAGFAGLSFIVPLQNSLLTAFVSTSLAMLVCIPAGYALAKFRMKGKELFSFYILLAYVFPPFVLITSIYLTIQNIGLHDTLFGLSILHLILMIPYNIWTLRGYFSTLPNEIEDSAFVDGCSRVKCLIKVVIPITAPGVASAAIFSFTMSWQDLLFAVITIDSFPRFTLPVALRSMVIGDTIRWGSLMAGVMLAILPPLILFLFMQRYIIQGLTAGAVKG